MGFSIAILASATLISTTITQSQKNIRNIEDVDIAFFAAESGIEEALYYMSFHKKGFQDAQSDTIITGNIPNVYYKWDIDNQIDIIQCPTGTDYENSDEQCRGELLFGKSATLNFSYDGRNKDNSSGSEIHTSPLNAVIKLFHTFNSNDLQLDDVITPDPENETYLKTINWLASYVDSIDNTEHKALANYTSPLGKFDADDCSLSTLNGNFICRNIMRGAENFASALSFPVDLTINALDGTTPTDLQNFFNPADTNQTWRKLKFFYISLLSGVDASKPSLGTIQYVITPSGTMTATKAVINSRGRSRNILSELTTKIDNTEEFTALDYGVLLE